MTVRRLVLLALLLLAPGAVGQETSVPAELRSMLRRRGPTEGKYGVHVVDAKTGEELFSVARDVPRTPASTMKLVTTAAALCELGGDYRLRTELLAASRPGPGGEIEGDLVVLGGGDPTLEAGREEASLDVLARRLARAGVRRIAGDLVLDDGRFDGVLRHPSWPEGQRHESYSAAVSALGVARNCVTVTVSPGSEAGRPARISLSPATGILRIVNEVTTTASRREHFLRFDLDSDAGEVRCRGRIWVESGGFDDEVAVDRPTLLFGDVFHRALVRSGIALKGRVVRRPGAAREITEPAVLASWETPLAELIEATNKPSQNLYAECILKTLGAQAAGEGSFSAGAAVAERFAEEAGVVRGELHQADGSGLSRENAISPRAMTAVLRHVYGTEHRLVFMKSLPTGGDPGGTLRKRLEDLGADIRAKTGTIRNVSTLAGYLRTSGGRVLCFAVLVNDPASYPTRARNVQDEISRILHRGY